MIIRIREEGGTKERKCSLKWGKYRGGWAILHFASKRAQLLPKMRQISLGQGYLTLCVKKGATTTKNEANTVGLLLLPWTCLLCIQRQKSKCRHLSDKWLASVRQAKVKLANRQHSSKIGCLGPSSKVDFKKESSNETFQYDIRYFLLFFGLWKNILIAIIKSNIFDVLSFWKSHFRKPT